MKRNLFFGLSGLCVLSLAACSAAQTAAVTSTVTTTVATAKTDVQNAVNFYGVAKGIALVAEAADPSLVPPLTAAIAVLDPLVATAQAALADATADAPTLETLATQLQTQAAALETTAAPAVQVVSSSK